MKKIIFGILVLVAFVVSGCELIENDPQKAGLRPYLVSGGGGGSGGSFVDNSPVIEQFEITGVACSADGGGYNNGTTNNTFSCDVDYRVYATDDRGIVSGSRMLTTPTWREGGAWSFPGSGVKVYFYNGSFDNLDQVGNYSITYKFNDAMGQSDTRIRYFSLP